MLLVPLDGSCHPSCFFVPVIMQRQVLAVLAQDYSEDAADSVLPRRCGTFGSVHRLFPIVNRDRHRRDIDKVVDVMQRQDPTAFRLPMEAMEEFRIFSTCSCSRHPHLDSGQFPRIWQTLAPVHMRQSTTAFGRISQFLRNGGARAVRTGNLSGHYQRAFCVAVLMGFLLLLRPFPASVRVDVSSDFLEALGCHQLLVVEGSLCTLSSRFFVDIGITSRQLVSETTRTTTTTATATTKVSARVTFVFVSLSIRDFMLASVHDANVTAAAGKRQRRLRQFSLPPSTTTTTRLNQVCALLLFGDRLCRV